VIPSAGGAVTPITPDEQIWAAGATWSPDGEWIAYVDNNQSLVIMRPDGTDRRVLPIDPGADEMVPIDPGADEIVGPSWGAAPQPTP
jgi:Tol biopolymer transport system component